MNIEQVAFEQSKQCSSICRQVVFALGALSWGLIKTGEENADTSCLIAILILVVLYMTIDIVQYLYYYLKIRSLVSMENMIDYYPEYTKEDKIKMRKAYEIERVDMERHAFRIFMTKMLILPFMIVLTGVALVGFL